MQSARMFIAVVAGCFLPLAAPSLAERRPDPPPAPVPAGVEKPPRGFLGAYQKLGSPRLLIYAHMLPMGDTNELGTLSAFEGRFRPYFMHPEVTVVFESASHFRSAAEFNELVVKNNLEAAKLVSRESPADYVILVSFVRQAARDRDVKYTQTYKILDMNRGQMVGTWSWEASPSRGSQDGMLDVRRLEQYAAAVAEQITADFVKLAAQSGTRNYRLQITGMHEARLGDLRRLLQSVKGVQAVLRPELDAKGAKFDVRYAGDSLDFSEVAREAIAVGLGMNASFVETSEGLIVVEVWPNKEQGPSSQVVAETTACEAMLNGDGGSAASADLQQAFTDAYAKANEPRIGIIINKEAGREEPREAGKGAVPSTAPAAAGGVGSPGTAGQNTVVCIQCRLGDSKAVEKPAPSLPGTLNQAPTDDAYLNAREMEDRLFRRFGVLKMERVDLKVAFDNLRAQQKLTREVYDEGELARLLGEEAQTQVVIAGAGKVVRFQSNVEVRYTFRAYEMGSARILANATVTRTINSRVSDIGEVTEAMAAEAVGQLACQMKDIWMPPNRIKVELSGARSARDVIESMRAIQKVPEVDRTVFRGFVEGKEKPGVGFMQIIYSCKCEDLIDRISQAKGLPFQLDNRSTNCDTLRLKAVDK